jgi:hypothetical protein
LGQQPVKALRKGWWPQTHGTFAFVDGHLGCVHELDQTFFAALSLIEQGIDKEGIAAVETAAKAPVAWKIV